jgi:hypothetical protein
MKAPGDAAIVEVLILSVFPVHPTDGWDRRLRCTAGYADTG